ncbi:MAG: SHOCT domain-containing protein [Kutzneria sp.]|nr:SHOCT domain-containing protein [Kutzneria sp.]
MYWWMTNWHNGPWHGGPFWIFPLVWLVLVVTAVVLLVVYRRRVFGHRSTAAGESVLSERFARGEIDEEEYRQRIAVLRGTRR